MHSKKTTLTVVLATLVLVGGCFVRSVNLGTEGNTYYLATNLWYRNPKMIKSTNYHQGAIIPTGTPVTIGNVDEISISFTTKETKLACKIWINKKHSSSDFTVKKLFRQYFSENNPMGPEGPFIKFTENEKSNIKDGTIEKGMKKEAVLMAYGYPPTHVTPSSTSNAWVYWRNKIKKTVVYFRKGKISEIKGSIR